MARSAAYVREAPAHTPPDLDPATLGLRPASFRGNHFPPKPSQNYGFLSKTSSATTAPCPGINKPASGALHAPTEPPFPAQNTWKGPRGPKRSSLSPPAPRGAGLQPSPSLWRGRVDPATDMQQPHPAAACPRPSPRSQAGAQTGTKGSYSRKYLIRVVHVELHFYTKRDTSPRNTVQNPCGSPKPLYNKDQEFPSLTNRLEDFPPEHL